MTDAAYAILLAEPDARLRALIASQISSIGAEVIQAADGESAFKALTQRDVRVVVTELYLKTGDDDDLIHAIRKTKAMRKTRVVAHTHFGTAQDRDWAMRAGADAYLIKPTRAERLRYVLTRLGTAKGANAYAPQPTTSVVARRDSLDDALLELENGALKRTSSIVFGRTWWEQLSKTQQSGYRKRAKTAGVSLRSDSVLRSHFVEIRGSDRDDPGLSTERPESPYRR